MSYMYLASPYNSLDARIRQRRYDQVCEALSLIAEAGIPVYSPIACWHPIADKHSLPKDHRFWKKQDESFLLRTTELWVLQLKGWDTSGGIASEIDFCKEAGIPVYYLKSIAAVPSFCIDRKKAFEG